MEINLSKKKAAEILKRVFGYSTFRPMQEDIIANVLAKNDTLVIMPTGGGKSLCYQIPALLFPGLTLVVSPLIALMKDQVEQLRESGIKTAILNSSLSYQEYTHNVYLLKSGQAKMLYLAPETLLKPKTQKLLKVLELDCLTIDEAHCISEWGHDFRPEYRRLLEVRDTFPEAVCIALTATATPRVQKDIMSSLQFQESNKFISSFDRKNLLIEIVEKNNPLRQTLDFLKKFPGQSGIIYCFSRKQVDSLSMSLDEKGFSVKPYHAGLSDEDRRTNQEAFIKDDALIIVATVAFGMGINKPNVRFIVHYDLPKNIESYYQEIGRCGRDGLDSHCLLLFSYADIHKIKFIISQKEESEQRVAHAHLSALLRFLESDLCRRLPLLGYFGDHIQEENCSMCDNCLAQKKEQVDITEIARIFFSAVKRTGQIYGTNHIIDVLRGSKSQKLIKTGHHLLTVYGKGKDYSKKQWFHISRQLIQKELLSQDLEYGSLKLNPKAYELFNKKEPIMGRLEEEKKTLKEKKKSIALEYDHIFYEELRRHRKNLADSAGLPPYMIFPDKTLMELAALLPGTETAFLEIHGVGRVKWEKYGAHFLKLIKEHNRKSAADIVGNDHEEVSWEPLPLPSIKKRAKPAPKKRALRQDFPPENSAPIKKKSGKSMYETVGKALCKERSLREVEEEYNIDQARVLDYLYAYLRKERILNIENENLEDELLSLTTSDEDLRTDVFKAFIEFGTYELKPIFLSFNEQVSYEEINILRLYYLLKYC